MPQLSMQQVEQLWIANGGDPGWAPLAAGLAWAESGWKSDIIADVPSTSDYSVGLWMVNYYGPLRADRTARYGTPEAMAADPNLQAKAAVDIFGNSAGARAWMGNDGHGNAAQKMFLAWRDAGFPQKPSEATVQSWITAKGGNPGAPGSADTFAGAHANTAANQSSSTSGCNAGSKGISLGIAGFDAVSGIGNACQLKAVTGGLLIGGGMALMLGGAVLLVAALAAGTKAGRTAAGIAGTVVGGPAGGAAASTAAGALSGAGRSSGASRAIAGGRKGAASARAAKQKQSKPSGLSAEAEAEAETSYRAARADASNPSPKRRAHMADRNAARRATRPRRMPAPAGTPDYEPF